MHTPLEMSKEKNQYNWTCCDMLCCVISSISFRTHHVDFTSSAATNSRCCCKFCMVSFFRLLLNSRIRAFQMLISIQQQSRAIYNVHCTTFWLFGQFSKHTLTHTHIIIYVQLFWLFVIWDVSFGKEINTSEKSWNFLSFGCFFEVWTNFWIKMECVQLMRTILISPKIHHVR